MSSEWRYGWVDRSIPEWVDVNAGDLPASACVVLSAIDSGREVSSSPMLADALGREREQPGTAMVMSVPELALVARTIFAGFEEVWILDADPPEPFEDAPKRLDCSDTMDEPTPELREWMDRYGVLVGLGDGLGLAFVCRMGATTESLDFVLA